MKFTCFHEKLERFSNNSCVKVLNCVRKSFKSSIRSSFLPFLFQINPFWIQLSYFVLVSLVGYLALKLTNPRKTTSITGLNHDLDVFFTSVSSATVSSMSTVEMEVFSNTQLVIITVLMFLGGEVFLSLIGLKLKTSYKSSIHQNNIDTNSIKLTSLYVNPNNNYVDQIKLRSIPQRFESSEDTKQSIDLESDAPDSDDNSLKDRSIRFLCYVILGYLLVFHIVGSILLGVYTSLVTSTRDVLTNKGLQTPTFSLFTTVSTFTNCGFIPTNENMVVFKKDSGLLLLLIPQILVGNTLYAPCLRFSIWVLEKITKREEFRYMMKKSGEEIGYGHMISGFHCWFLVGTVFGFIFVQFVVFCFMGWDSDAMEGLNTYQKLVGILFQVVNSRHAGESVFDLSTLPPAILVLFIVMMYLPPYTSFMPKRQDKEDSRTLSQESKKQRQSLIQYLLFSQLSYLVIFVIIICITEREKMKEDPLNFNVLNITMEVISAYGNVGFTSGYSCKRQLKPVSSCHDSCSGFVGRWSSKGKLTLIIVMFYGRLKKFSMAAGKDWKLS